MRFHVVSLPHTQTHARFSQCGFTSNVVKFCNMMKARGHEILLYASEDNEASCDELVTCITKAQQELFLGRHEWYWKTEPYGVEWNAELPLWKHFNEQAILTLRERLRARDVICTSAGVSQHSIVDAFPDHQRVEITVGYEGVYAPYRVFPSYAWMHAIYGRNDGPSAADGQFFDAVIPHAFEPTDFAASKGAGDYLLFMSRMTWRKGYQIAIDTAERSGLPLKIAGAGGDRPRSDAVEYVGFADPVTRSELMSRARAVMMPTLFLEPFGMVAAEALMCGTPVISTDWGALPEIVRQGVDGYRCRSMSEFVGAVEDVRRLDRAQIREGAVQRFSTTTVGEQFERYFERLMTLWGAGFYA